jgi:hypothetical protein
MRTQAAEPPETRTTVSPEKAEPRFVASDGDLPAWMLDDTDACCAVRDEKKSPEQSGSVTKGVSAKAEKENNHGERPIRIF